VEKERAEAKGRRLELPIRGMSCASYVRKVEAALRGVPGVLRAEVSLAAERATVEFIPGVVTSVDLRRAVTEIGYEVPEELEPDHAAGITALASGKGVRRPFLTGIFFALEHVVLVVGWLIVLSLGVRAISQGVTAAVGERLVEGIPLGIIMVVQVIHDHLHRHRGLEHRLPGLPKISLIGSAFAPTLPLSIMAFLSAVAIKEGLKLLLILPYALAITLSMGLVGASVGAIARYLQSKRPFPAFKGPTGMLIIGCALALFLMAEG